MGLSSGEDFLWRPVRAGLCRWSEVLDGTYSLDDIADMNELLDVERENQLRIDDARQQE